MSDAMKFMEQMREDHEKDEIQERLLDKKPKNAKEIKKLEERAAEWFRSSFSDLLRIKSTRS